MTKHQLHFTFCPSCKECRADRDERNRAAKDYAGKTDLQLCRSLARESGRGQYEMPDSEIEEYGEFHIHERETTSPEGLRIAKELERRGWKIQGTDKGALFVKPEAE